MLRDLVRVRLAGGWAALVPTSTEWLGAIENPESLLRQPEKVLKRPNRTYVVVKTIVVGGESLRVAAKQIRPKFGLDFGFGRAAANLRAAIRLFSLGIPVARPLGALCRKRLYLAAESIYISEYIDGQTLYEFLDALLLPSQARAGAIKEDLLAQVASIFARMHKAGLWNRDAKATNFVVRSGADGKCEIFLTDMDGIKRYRIDKHRQQFRPFRHLIASLMPLGRISRDDWFSMFETYCVCVGIDRPFRQDIFNRIMDEAKEKCEHRLRKQTGRNL